MKSVAKMKCALALVIGGILAAGPVVADNHSSAWSGKGGKGGKDERRDRRDHDESSQRDRDRDGHSTQKGRHFEDRHRVIVREYYVEDFRGGRCPPGLRKRQNGCVPPGQAKKWQVGRPLPREVIFHDVPRQLVVQIGLPPSGYRYVRVASDILMIAVGTGMVIDAIYDLGR